MMSSGIRPKGNWTKRSWGISRKSPRRLSCPASGRPGDPMAYLGKTDSGALFAGCCLRLLSPNKPPSTDRQLGAVGPVANRARYGRSFADFKSDRALLIVQRWLYPMRDPIHRFNRHGYFFEERRNPTLPKPKPRTPARARTPPHTVPSSRP
jgi:hypothetical protein